MGFVIWTQTAVIGALFLSLGSRIRYAFADFAVFLKSFVCFDVSPIHVFEVPMLRAVFHQQDLTVSFDDCGCNAFQTLRAQTQRLLQDVVV
jgi:hypothetical protein